MSCLAAVVAGFGFCLSFIAVFGAQNAFVLRQGLLRQHVLAVVFICTSADWILIPLGIHGIRFFIDETPALVDVHIAGAVFLAQL